MSIILHPESHRDHAITEPILKWLLERFADKTEAFIETVELPKVLGTVPCALYGPAMGDEPIAEKDAFYRVRGNRQYTSRLVNRPMRATNKVTIIVGPHDNQPTVLYTCFGGPLSPMEAHDPNLSDAKMKESLAFWSEHALAAS